jgi:HEAT repeat protein
MLDYLIRRGTLAGRRAASKALEEFTGADANALTLHALNDQDPTVQANVLPTLRRRGIPGGLAKLIELLESPHELVSGAARECLAEFSFKRYLAAFDLLEEDVRRSTGSIVRRVDGDVRSQLEAELASLSRVRRLRAVKVAAAIGMVEDVYPALIKRLRDEDHMIRTEAAWALGDCESPEIIEALELALSDRSVTVQEAARRSLRKLAPLAETSEAPPMLPWETSSAPTEEAM